jgi:hypothetical protein
MTAMQGAGAASRCKARWQQMGIVKVEWKRPTGFCKEPLEMLELLEGKLSRAVLRGLGGSNPAWLPGTRHTYRVNGPYPTQCKVGCVSGGFCMVLTTHGAPLLSPVS